MRRLLPVLLVLPFGAICTSAAGAPDYDWFSVPLTVEGLQANAEFVPVRCRIDFAQMLQHLGRSGAIDEHSLRLFLTNQQHQLEEPVQFSPLPQPRSGERTLLPGTTPQVSYLNEYPAGATPGGVRVAGELTWIARGGTGGRTEYRLDFGVLRTGRAVQVPFTPQNLRMFDGAGRATPVHDFPVMQIHPQWPAEGLLHIYELGHLVTSYHLGPVGGLSSPVPYRRPFFYPLNGPDGISVTEFGKPHDPTGSHAHHYSLWIAHAQVESQDFWSEKGGLIVQDDLEGLEDGPVFCRLVAKARWATGDKALLRDRREFTFYRAAPDFRLIDIDLQLRPTGPAPVTFGKTTFGFLAARVAQSMTVFDGAGEILNAKGERNERGAHLRRAPWIDQSGLIAPDKWNGLAIFDHTENPNFPTAWHCRNDGWAGAAFNMDGEYKLEPEHVLHLRYRLCLHRYDAVEGKVEKRYTEYAAKPLVQIGAAEPKSK